MLVSWECTPPGKLKIMQKQKNNLPNLHFLGSILVCWGGIMKQKHRDIAVSPGTRTDASFVLTAFGGGCHSRG